MGSYRIAVLPGDGIGPEITEAALHVLDTVLDSAPGLQLRFVKHPAGAEFHRQNGKTLPESVLHDCLEADAVLLSAIGLPDVCKPDGTEVQAEMMMGLRRAMGLFAAVRPVKLYPGVPCPLNTASAGIDLVIVRENLEGLFASFGGGCIVGDQAATDTMVITREGTRRVAEFAFRLAAHRNGRALDGRRCVTCVDKANVFRSLAFFRKVFFEVADHHPEIAADAVYVDAMSYYLVRCPANFDVLVTENEFGDILSELGAAIMGGLGMAPSAELGDKHGLFQPSHGSAPPLAGRNVANPLAMILSAGMMLDWLGDRHKDPAATRAAATIESAVKRVLAEGRELPADLGGDTGTAQVAEAVARIIAGSHRESASAPEAASILTKR